MVAGPDPLAARLYRTDQCLPTTPVLAEDRVDAVAASPQGLVVAVARDPSGQPSVDRLYNVSDQGQLSPLLGQAPAGQSPVAGPDGDLAWTTAFEPEPQPPFAVYVLCRGQARPRAVYRSLVPLSPVALGGTEDLALVEQPAELVGSDKGGQPATLVLMRQRQVLRRQLLSPGRVTGLALSDDGQSLSVTLEGTGGFREDLPTRRRQALPIGWRTLDYQPGTHDLLLAEYQDGRLGGRLGTLAQHAGPDAIRLLPDLGVGPVYGARYLRGRRLTTSSSSSRCRA